MDKIKANKKVILIATAVITAVVFILVMFFSTGNNEKNFIGKWESNKTYQYNIKQTDKGYLLQTLYVNRVDGEYPGTYDKKERVMVFDADGLIYEFKFDEATNELLKRSKFGANDNDPKAERLHKVSSNEWK